MELHKILPRLRTLVLVVAGIVALVQLIIIGTTIPPESASSQVLWTFFLCYWIVLSLVLAVLLYIVKRFIVLRNHLRHPFSISLRQGCLLAGVVVVCSFFNSIDILHLWDGIPLTVAAILIEFFFQAEKRPLARISHESFRP